MPAIELVYDAIACDGDNCRERTGPHVDFFAAEAEALGAGWIADGAGSYYCPACQAKGEMRRARPLRVEEGADVCAE